MKGGQKGNCMMNDFQKTSPIQIKLHWQRGSTFNSESESIHQAEKKNKRGKKKREKIQYNPIFPFSFIYIYPAPLLYLLIPLPLEVYVYKKKILKKKNY